MDITTLKIPLILLYLISGFVFGAYSEMKSSQYHTDDDLIFNSRTFFMGLSGSLVGFFWLFVFFITWFDKHPIVIWRFKK